MTDDERLDLEDGDGVDEAEAGPAVELHCAACQHSWRQHQDSHDHGCLFQSGTFVCDCQGFVFDAARVESLLKAAAERDEFLGDLRRLAADFDNFRKRAQRDQEELRTRAAERLVKELLPIADDLERALEAAAAHEEAQLADGVEMVHRQLVMLLAKEGVAEIAAAGLFDPHVHEALTSMPSDAPEGSVLEVISKGYTLGGKVVRPARVIVAAARPLADGPQPEAREGEEG